MIPNDPVMLLSYVNTQLRDYYSSLDALCEDKGIGKEELEKIGDEIYARIDAAEGFKQQIEKRLNHSIEIDPNRKITCSIGIAMDSQARSEDDMEILIKKADDSLYAVKTGGKGHYAFI